MGGWRAVKVFHSKQQAVGPLLLLNERREKAIR